MLKTRIFVKIVLALVLMNPLPQCLAVMLVHDPTNFKQNLLAVKNSIENIRLQLTSLQLQTRNMMSVDSVNIRDIDDVLLKINRLASNGQAMSYTLGNLQREFDKLYPSYTNNQSLGQPANQGTVTLNTMKTTLESLHESAKLLSHEKQLLQTLSHQSQRAEGQKQVMQVTNQLIHENIQQMRVLRQLIANQTNAQAAYMSQQLSKKNHEEATLKKLTQNLSDSTQHSTKSGGFGLLSTSGLS